MEEYELEHTGCARQEAVLVRGGNRLCGELTVQGAKNSTLPLLAAALLCEGETVLHNCPALSDVHTAVTILRRLGCRCTHTGDTLTVCADGMTRCDIPHSLMREMRSSIVFLGAILSRCGEARLSFPGGCELGPSPIDLHLEALRKLGAEIREEHGCLLCTAPGGLRGGFVSLAFPSVGATENLILAALGCRGTLTLCNAAREPEIGDLIAFLRACGADIRGEGSLLRIRGGVPLTGARHTVLPDRMEAATYLAAAAATRGDVTLTNVRPEHLTAVLAALERAGCTLTQQNGSLRLQCSRLRAAGPIRTAPYDGFPTDAQAPLMAAMAVAEGVTVFEENLFENRFRHVPALRALGAHIHAARRYAVVTGVRELHGASMTATDLRGGAAMVIGALCARGESELAGTAHLKRGYAQLVPTLRACGADITER